MRIVFVWAADKKSVLQRLVHRQGISSTSHVCAYCFAFAYISFITPSSHSSPYSPQDGAEKLWTDLFGAAHYTIQDEDNPPPGGKIYDVEVSRLLTKCYTSARTHA